MTDLIRFRPRTLRSVAVAEREQRLFAARPGVPTRERLTMDHDAYHLPVLEQEIVAFFADQPMGIIVDATLGGGGHTAALLAAAPQRRVIGIDRDPEARRAAAERLAAVSERVFIAAAPFSAIASVVEEAVDFIGDDQVVGVLMDLGVSSHQLDDATRGFSFRADAPLDMRMDPTVGLTAAQLIAVLDVHELTRLLRLNGEDRFAGAIARAVIARAPQTTDELTAAVESAVPMAARRRGHVATRTFQALRIAVNDELHQLDEGLRAAVEVLAPEGRLAVISYHSGEDRAVKSFFHEGSTGGCRCPHELGCVCGAIATLEVGRASATLASGAEVDRNPRARSARLRTARKLNV